MRKLSVVILTSNEEAHITTCLNSVSFADEIIIIDDNSSDATVSLAKKTGAQVYSRKLDDFASQRNYGLSMATGEWVLFLDADETVSKELQKEIISVVHQ